jgi:hypothetical protein
MDQELYIQPCGLYYNQRSLPFFFCLPDSGNVVTFFQRSLGRNYKYRNGTTVAPMGGWPPLLGSGEGMLSLLLCAVSFTLFSLIPKATEIVQGLVSGRPYAYGTAIGEAFGPIGDYGKGAAVRAGARWLGKETNLGKLPIPAKLKPFVRGAVEDFQDSNRVRMETGSPNQRRK